MFVLGALWRVTFEQEAGLSRPVINFFRRLLCENTGNAVAVVSTGRREAGCLFIFFCKFEIFFLFFFCIFFVDIFDILVFCFRSKTVFGCGKVAGLAHVLAVAPESAF